MPELIDYINQIQLSLETVANHITAMRDALMEARKMIIPVPMKKLNIPWLSQLGASASFAPGDCGTACIAMLANSRGITCTVDDVSKITGRPAGFLLLSFAELIAAALHYGFTLRHEQGATIEQLCADIDAGKPSIVIVNYRSLPASNRYDVKYNSGHYLIVVGYGSDSIVYHDPYWQTAEGGAYRVLTHSEFETAYSTAAPGNTYARHSLRLVN